MIGISAGTLPKLKLSKQLYVYYLASTVIMTLREYETNISLLAKWLSASQERTNVFLKY